MGQKAGDEKSLAVPLADIYVNDGNEERGDGEPVATEAEGSEDHASHGVPGSLRRPRSGLAAASKHGGSGDSLDLLTVTSRTYLLRKSMLGSVPLPEVVYRPPYQPAKHDDLAVTSHFLGHVVRMHV